MKALNRPMFKNGGPIKEGIMHGMQDGGLANNEGPRRAALVGNSMYDQTKGLDGRTKHFAPLVAGGMMLANAARAIPTIYRGFKAARTFAPGNIGAKSRFKDIFLGSGRFRQGQVPVQGNMLTDAQIKAGMVPKIGQRGILESLKDPRSLGAAIREYPATALSALTLPNAALTVGPSIIKGGIGAGKMFIDAVLPGKQFQGDDKIKETGDSKKLEIVDNIKTVPNGDTSGSTTSDAEKTKINEDRINETKQKYYKLMGIDKMNKNAAYDSLIDASKIIQEEGGDLKGSVKSGTLQNRIIQAISGNLDKSADLKKQIDAAVLKGEITKDINLTKPSAFAEQVQYLKDNPNDPLARKLANVTSVADMIAMQNAQGKKVTTSNDIASYIISKGTDAAAIPDDKYQKWEKGNEDKNELNFIQENFSGLENGVYVVNKKGVQVQDGKIAFLDLDSIIG